MRMRIVVPVLMMALFLCVIGAHAQTASTPAPASAATAAPAANPVVTDLLESGEPFSISGSYGASSGNAVNNGVQATMEFRMTQHWGARIDTFNLSNPSNTVLSLAEAQWKESLAHLIKPTSFINTTPILIGVHAGPGVLKSPDGGASFAVGAGVSVDYVVTSIFHVRILDFTYAYSRGLGNAGIPLGNYPSVGTGVGFDF
jgi:hypothetical protein